MTQVATNYVREFQSVEADATNKAGENKYEPGCWIPVNPTDPHVIHIGKFAVAEQNKKAHTNLVFVKVIEGWQQYVCRGMNYKLIIEAKDQNPVPQFPVPQLYEAVVYEALPSGKKELISFVPLLRKEGVN